ncbi:MAG: hypothetical protein ACLFTZ_06040 [Acholeplasmataceae bacterium]
MISGTTASFNGIFRGDDPEKTDSPTVRYGHVTDMGGSPVDATLFQAPRSFTVADFIEG